ncbi:VOC family protein [Tsukamurella strandjordii]|uniref:VOC family protein n=1 Tax=Tsukamurella TaxID=2060 RepID=UPI001C7DD30A|nr:VOC family protein [Tsukamurella sp. TY48]GIZ97519.1 hypothetical protein TTY48_21310 [Tsukamurella sp. TY48]
MSDEEEELTPFEKAYLKSDVRRIVEEGLANTSPRRVWARGPDQEDPDAAQREYDENPELREMLKRAAESPRVTRSYQHRDLPPEVQEIVDRGLSVPHEGLHPRPLRRHLPPEVALMMLYCNDVEASAQFYRILGFDLRAERVGDIDTYRSTGSTTLWLWPAGERLPVTYVRLGCNVADPAATVEALRAEGFSVAGDVGVGPRCAVDPDGNPVELGRRGR